MTQDRITQDSGTSATRDRILDATLELLRRHGPAKTGVVDVARALSMSHSNVYKHFASKSDLFDAVAERWLDAVNTPLRKIVASDGPASARLKKWVRTLAQTKRKKVLDDPELFAVYGQITQGAHDVVARHIGELHAMVTAIIKDGARAKDWPVKDAGTAATVILNATTRFHHPAMVAADAGASDLGDLDRIMDALITALKAGAA